MMQTRALDGTHEDVLPTTMDDGALRYAALLPAMLEHPRSLQELRILDDGDRAKLQLRADKLRPRLTNELIAEAVTLLDLA